MVKDVTALCYSTKEDLIFPNGSATIAEDCRAKEVMDLDLDMDQLQMEQALGLQWCIKTDKFKFRTSLQEQPQTKRHFVSGRLTL